MKNGFSPLVLTLFLLSAFLSPIQANEESSPETPLRTDVGVEEWEMELGKLVPELLQKAGIPGLSMAIVKDGDIVWSATFGVRDSNSKEPVKADTVFQAASLSKPVFAYCVMKLVEEKILKLDTPLAEYLPHPDVKDDSRVNLITARMVLSHVTGFPNWRPRDGELKIYFQPGERFSYSGEGYVYLQKVVEHLTSQNLDDLVRLYVFKPLEMNDSGFVWREDYANRVAHGHNSLGEPRIGSPMTEANAAASLYTTARDYAKFLGAVLRGEGLDAYAVHQMTRPIIPLDEGCINCTNRPKPEKLSTRNYWAGGWGLQRTAVGDAIWHWGNQGIFMNYVSAFLAPKLGVVYLTNGANGLSIRDELVTCAIGGPHPAFSWMRETQYDAPIKVFERTLFDKGWEAAQTQYESLTIAAGNQTAFGESELNRLGYRLMQAKRFEDAIATFKLNVDAYPDSFNVYDSLAEGYFNLKDYSHAREMYQKSLALNPDNDNGKKMLARIEKEQAERSRETK